MLKLLPILFLVFFSACNDQKVEKTEQPEKIFQGQIDSLNKAKAIEDTLLKADQQLRKQINEQSN
ncbi:MAG: hypothetical protein GXP13_07115 [Gammaproteobacteria bacterium]|nr:hypothetical protein [Gammaproteobacteria bacterium]